MSERRKKRRPRNKRGGGPSQWQLQQTKVTFRNIEDSTKFGTAESILTMVSDLISKVNDNNKGTLPPIKLDMKSFEKIIQIEELIAEQEREEEQKETDGEQGEATQDEEMNDAEATADTEPKDDEKPAPKTMAEVVKGDTAEVEGPVITARALYVVPAKKSRRRGEKTGCAYFVMTAPPPPPPAPRVVKKPVEVTENPVENEVTVDESTEAKPCVVDDKVGVEPGVVSPTEDQKVAAENGEGAAPEKKADSPQKDKVVEIKAPAGPLYTQAEKSRLTAVAKLQLLNVIDALSAIAEQDAKTHQNYGKCQVAASISGKAWRDKEGGHRDRREGTIQNTGDYKQFFAKQNKAVEERQSRPKPAPGGGATSENGDSAQPVSAIVAHLRAKRQESSQRKKAKKKANKDAKKGKQPENSGRGRNNAKGGGGRGRQRKEGSKKNSGVSAVMTKAG